MKIALMFKSVEAKNYFLKLMPTMWSTSEGELGISPLLLWIYDISSVVDIKSQININRGANTLIIKKDDVEYYEISKDLR